MRKWLAIVALVPIFLAATEKPFPVQRKDQEQHTQTKSAETQPNAPQGFASEIAKGNAANTERYTYYKTHPKEYLKTAFAPANLSNWILAAIGIVATFVALFTLSAVKKQADHIAISERAWIVAEMCYGPENPLFLPVTGNIPIKAEVMFKNKGKTPAFILEVGIAMQAILKNKSLPDTPPPYELKNTADWEEPGICISPKNGFMRYVFCTIEDPVNIVNGSSTLYVYGHIKYRDVFTTRGFFRRKTRETRYCFSFSPPKPQFGMGGQFIEEGHPAYTNAT